MLRLLLLALLLAAAPLAQAQTPSGRDAHREFVTALAMQWTDDHAGAISALDALLDIEPENGAVFDALAESYIALDRDEEALLAMEAASRFAPEESSVWVRLADLTQEADPVAAAGHLETALRLRPNDPGILADLSDLYASLGRESDAARTLTALARVGETPAVHVRLAVIANASGDQTAELFHLRRAYALAPSEGAIAMLLATALRDSDLAPEARTTLDRYLSRRPSDGAARALRAELGGAAPEAAALDARTPADRLRRARDLFDASGEDDDALGEAEALIESVLDEAATAEALALGGRIAFRQRQYALAADRLVRALDADPRDAGAWPLAVRALVRSGDERAKGMADDATLFLGANPEVAAAASESALARGDAEEALRLAPDTPDGHALRAMALAALGRADEAADALTAASGADPVLFDAASGDAADARGDSTAARAAWDRALALDPTNVWLQTR